MPFKTPKPLYHIWNSMRQRCNNPNYVQWADYGGRGITICERWNSYDAWAADMGPRPEGYVIDRINNDGNYEPGNCRWTTRRENQLNRRVTVWLTIEGERHRLSDLAVQSGLKSDAIKARAQLGLSLAEVLSPERRTFHEGLAMGGLANGARQRARTHCIYGHQFDPTESYEGRPRYCRECKRQKVARYRQRKKAAHHCPPA